jgi:hypothetical protein
MHGIPVNFCEEALMNRRNLLGAGLASIVMPLSMRVANAGGSNDNSEDMVTMLFVQSAHGAELANGKLRLTGVNPSTIFFSDRPERIVGHEPTEDFVSNWGEGEDSFQSNPPNATLSIVIGPEPQEIVLVLKSPSLEGNDLLYDVEVLDGPQKITGGASSLFIDTVGRPASPGSVAGVKRRERRRTVSRVR